MNALIRKIVVAVCGVVVIATLIAFASTGARAYTRFRSPEIEEANSQTDLSDLFAQTGAPQEQPPNAVESVNAVGFLPSGPGLASISVVTLAGPAVGLMLVMWWLGRRKRLERDSVDDGEFASA